MVATAEKELTLSVEFSPNIEAAESIQSGLHRFNAKFTKEPPNAEAFMVLIKNRFNIPIGGLHGWVHWGWFYINGLWIRSEYRKQGHGRNIINAAEKGARSLGATHSRLETTEFQARGFYQKMGYQTFAEVDDMPPGYKSYFMKKDL